MAVKPAVPIAIARASTFLGQAHQPVALDARLLGVSAEMGSHPYPSRYRLPCRRPSTADATTARRYPARSTPAIIGKRPHHRRLAGKGETVLVVQRGPFDPHRDVASINSASSNCVSAAVVPLSALSILIALNVPKVTSRFFLSGCLPDQAARATGRATGGLDNRQVDQRRQHSEQDR